MRMGIAALLLVAAGCEPTDAGTQAAHRGRTSSNANTPNQPAPAVDAREPGDQVDGVARRVTVAGRTVRLRPFRVIGGQGLSAAQCGIVLDGRRVPTLGAGDLDAYTCLKLIETRTLPTIGGGERLALLYDAQSPNTLLRTAVVMERVPGDEWTVVPDATRIYDDLPVKSWPAFAAALDRSR